MNKNSNNSMTVLVLYIVAFALLWTVAYPMYSGGGFKIFERPTVLNLLAEAEGRERSKNLADSFFSTGDKNYADYKTITDDTKAKIGSILYEKIDFSKVFNDINEIAAANNVYFTSPTFSVSQNNNLKKTLPANISAYEVSFLLKTSQYQNFKSFLLALEKNSRFYNIASISFREVENEKDPRVNYNITMYVYEINK